MWLISVNKNPLINETARRMDLNLDSDKAYKAEVRVTGTRGFGDSSLSQSFSRGTPEEVTNHG